MRAVVETRVGLAATTGGLVEDRAVEVGRNDVVCAANVEGGIGGGGKGLEFGLGETVDVDAL